MTKFGSQKIPESQLPPKAAPQFPGKLVAYLSVKICSDCELLTPLPPCVTDAESETRVPVVAPQALMGFPL